MKDKDYRAILSSIDDSLRLMGDEAPENEADLQLYQELRKIRETLIRSQRDSLDKNLNVKRPHSRSPLGVSG